ncbi:MAG: PQQ-binding-like beta-propeller repeat protein [Acidobacteriota bacterium]
MPTIRRAAARSGMRESSSRCPFPCPSWGMASSMPAAAIAAGPTWPSAPVERVMCPPAASCGGCPPALPYVSSLLYYRGLLYMASEKGIVRAVEPATGKTAWISRTGGKFWASPVGADGKIYLQSEDGSTVILSPGRTASILARNHLEGRFVASPAISRGQIILRSDHHLFCIGKGRLAPPVDKTGPGGPESRPSRPGEET